MHGIIDGDILIYRACHKAIKEDIDVTGVFDDLYNELLDKLACSSYSLHVSNGGNFRKDLRQKFTIYKGKRKTKPVNYKYLKDYILKTYDCISVPLYEADDTAAIEATELRNSGKLYTLATVDKDWIQIGGIMFNMQYNTLKAYSVEEGIAFFHKQLITGDSVDNIPGIFGMGEKKADRLLSGKDLKEQFESIIRVYKREYKDDDPINTLNNMGRMLFLVRDYKDPMWNVDLWRAYLNGL